VSGGKVVAPPVTPGVTAQPPGAPVATRTAPPPTGESSVGAAGGALPDAAPAQPVVRSPSTPTDPAYPAGAANVDTTPLPLPESLSSPNPGGGYVPDGVKPHGNVTLQGQRKCVFCGDPNYSGSGMTDPEPIRGVYNEQMMAWATATDSSDERRFAIVSVARRKLPGAMDAIRRALADGDHMVRTLGVSALMEMGGPDALKTLWDVARNGHDDLVRSQAVTGISLWGGEQTLKAAEWAAVQDNPVVLGAAVRQLHRLGDRPEVWSFVEKAIDHPDQRVWQEAAWVCGKLGGKDALRIVKPRWSEATGQRREALEFYADKAYKKTLNNGWKDQDFRP